MHDGDDSPASVRERKASKMCNKPDCEWIRYADHLRAIERLQRSELEAVTKERNEWRARVDMMLANCDRCEKVTVVQLRADIEAVTEDNRNLRQTIESIASLFIGVVMPDTWDILPDCVRIMMEERSRFGQETLSLKADLVAAVKERDAWKARATELEAARIGGALQESNKALDKEGE